MSNTGPALGTEPVKKLIWRFAIPGIISALVNAVYNIVDQIFIGWGIGDLGIAATNIAFPLATLITAFSALYGMGGASRFNLAMGRKETQEAARTACNSLVLMVLSGTLLALLAVLFLEPMLYLFGATDLIMPYAKPYTLIVSIGIPFGIFSVGASYLVRSDGNPTFSMVIPLSGAMFNLIFDPIFLFVFDMGIEGIALATTLGQVLSAGIALFYLMRRFKSVKLERRGFRLQGEIVKGICSLGVAAFFTHVAGTVVQIILSNSLRYYGAASIYGSEVALAAAGAVSKVMILFLSSAIGVSLGCQPIVGYNYGSKQYDRVKETYFLAIRYTSTIAVIAFLCMQLFPRQILMLFGSDDPLFFEFATRYMRIYLFMTFINTVQPVTSTFFTSIGKANLGFWMSLTRQVLLLIPLLILLPRYIGMDGILFAGPIADGVAAVLVIFFAVREMRAITRLQKIQEQALEQGG